MPCGASRSAIWLDAGLVGADAAADRQRRAVDPDAVAALDRARRLDPAEDRDADAAVGRFVQRRLGTPQRLAHRQDDRAVVGHQRRIVGEDGIGEPVVRVGQPFDLGAGGGDQIGEVGVLLGGPRRRRSPAHSASRAGFGAAHGACGRAHQHAPQRRGHGLRTERAVGWMFIARPPGRSPAASVTHAARQRPQGPADGGLTAASAAGPS